MRVGLFWNVIFETAPFKSSMCWRTFRSPTTTTSSRTRPSFLSVAVGCSTAYPSMSMATGWEKSSQSGYLKGQSSKFLPSWRTASFSLLGVGWFVIPANLSIPTNQICITISLSEEVCAKVLCLRLISGAFFCNKYPIIFAIETEK